MHLYCSNALLPNFPKKELETPLDGHIIITSFFILSYLETNRFNVYNVALILVLIVVAHHRWTLTGLVVSPTQELFPIVDLSSIFCSTPNVRIIVKRPTDS